MIDGVYDGNLLSTHCEQRFYKWATSLRIYSEYGRIGFLSEAARFCSSRMRQSARRTCANDDKPLGHTQLLISANDVVSHMLRSKPSIQTRDKEVEALRRKAEILLNSMK